MGSDKGYEGNADIVRICTYYEGVELREVTHKMRRGIRREGNCAADVFPHSAFRPSPPPPLPAHPPICPLPSAEGRAGF